MKEIDFSKETPYFDNGEFKWYVDKHFQNYLKNSQANNLPKLKGFGCFVVIGKDTKDYVLINDKQQALASYLYNSEGEEQMEARIKIMKISKHFDDNE